MSFFLPSCRSVCKDYTAHFEKFLTTAKPNKDLRRKVKVSNISMHFLQELGFEDTESLIM